MMQVIWKPKATKQLKKIGDKVAQAGILYATSGLVAFPAVTGIKALANHQYMYRMRVGNYRVLFDVSTTVQVVSIEEVRKRDERTY
jgi:mRNA-degrading endonuclease RelE of RelBE toxin-antitoxin system